MELLVRVVHKVPPDHPSHHLLTQAGDVIAYREDGADWGRKELRNPDWRIIRVPGLTQVEAEGLTAIDVDSKNRPNHPRKRHMRLDLKALEALGHGLRVARRCGTFPAGICSAGTRRS